MTENNRRDEREMKITLTMAIRVEVGLRKRPTQLSWMTLFNPQEYILKFLVALFIRRLSRMEGPLWRYLEDVEGS